MRQSKCAVQSPVRCGGAFLGVALFAAVLVASTLRPADAGLLDGAYGADQVFDCQRSPAYPEAGQPFTASDLTVPYRDNGNQYELGVGEYIRFFYVGGSCASGKVGIDRFDASGSFVEEISASGTVYGLDEDGFLYVADDGDWGTFISNGSAHASSGVATYVATIGLVDNCTLLDEYVASSDPIALAQCTPAPLSTCVAAGKGQLTLQGNRDPDRQKLEWKWRDDSQPIIDFGDPVSGATSYRLCIYDDGALVLNPVITTDSTCRKGSCWKATPRGFEFKSKPGSIDSITRVDLTSGSDMTRITVQGKGVDLAFPLVNSTSVTVQLVKDSGSGPECWETDLPAPARIYKEAKQTYMDRIP